MQKKQENKEWGGGNAEFRSVRERGVCGIRRSWENSTHGVLKSPMRTATIVEDSGRCSHTGPVEHMPYKLALVP